MGLFNCAKGLTLGDRRFREDDVERFAVSVNSPRKCVRTEADHFVPEWGEPVAQAASIERGLHAGAIELRGLLAIQLLHAVEIAL